MTGRPPKLSADQVRRLREWAANRQTARSLAAELGIGVSTLRAYLRGERKNYPRATA